MRPGPNGVGEGLDNTLGAAPVAEGQRSAVRWIEPVDLATAEGEKWPPTLKK